jgi:hypothetical protein
MADSKTLFCSFLQRRFVVVSHLNLCEGLLAEVETPFMRVGVRAIPPLAQESRTRQGWGTRLFKTQSDSSRADEQANCPSRGEQIENGPRGGWVFWGWGRLGRGHGFSLFLPVHLSLLLFPSLHERIIILCTHLRCGQKPSAGGLRFVAGDQGSGDQGTRDQENWDQGTKGTGNRKTLVGVRGFPPISQFKTQILRLRSGRNGWGARLFWMVRILKNRGAPPPKATL